MSAAPSDPLLDEAQRAVDANPRDAAGWHRLGLALQKRGRHGDAVQALTKATSLERSTARYHHDLGNALADDGKPDQAISAYRRALRIDDTLAEAHNDLGTAYYEKGWYAEAETCFRKAIALKADHGVAYANLGAALRVQGRLQEGRRAFQRALLLKIRALLPAFLRWSVDVAAAQPVSASAEAAQAVRSITAELRAGRLREALAIATDAETRYPAHPDVLYLAAMVGEEQHEIGAAMARIDAALALKPDRAEYHVLRARLLVAMGKEAEALEAALRGLQLEPGSADGHAVLSVAYRPTRRDLAEQAARKAIELDASSHAAHNSLSYVLWMNGHMDEAVHHAREALRLAPRAPLYALNLAVVLKDAGGLEEARQLYRQAIQNPPKHPGALLNMGTLALVCDADLKAARDWYAKCQENGPDDRATQSESIVDLLESRFEAAWPKYETRRRAHGHRERHQVFSGIPAWSGQPMPSGRLLVYGEQGLGDEIMFASMLPDLLQRAAAVEVVCDSRLAPLLARSFPGVAVTPVKSEQRPEARTGPDCAVAMGSLGMHFRRSAADFPPHRGYLVSDRKRSDQWRERLAALGQGRKVGISWVGGTYMTGRARRSLTLQQLRPLLESPGIDWVSLQYGDVSKELEEFKSATGIAVHAFPGAAEDMDELASLVDALDLVVSVCNTTVHVAGAIGKEVLVMAPFLPEWRYGMRGERMLWYPSARVFRQPAMGDWDSVISAVKAKLQS